MITKFSNLFSFNILYYSILAVTVFMILLYISSRFIPKIPKILNCVSGLFM
jgi:hypothetical protein